MNVHLYRTRLPDAKLNAVNFNGEKCATHISGKKKLCDVLQKRTCFMAITTDAWTSKSVKSFAMYTVHFIDGNMLLIIIVTLMRSFRLRITL